MPPVKEIFPHVLLCTRVVDSPALAYKFHTKNRVTSSVITQVSKNASVCKLMRNERRMEIMQSVSHFSATAIGKDRGGGGSSSSSSSSSSRSISSQNLYFVVCQQQKNKRNA